MKRKYIVKIETDKINNFDSNLDKALKDIKAKKYSYEDEFDFEIEILFDEFIVDEFISSIINTFLHDIMKEDSMFNSIYNSSSFVAQVKKFIIKLLDIKEKEDDAFCTMQAFIYTKYWGEVNQFYFDFALPKTIITQEKYDDLLGLGANYVMGNLTPMQMFEYFLAPLYLEMARTNVLDVEEFKNIAKYQMGLK